MTWIEFSLKWLSLTLTKLLSQLKRDYASKIKLLWVVTWSTRGYSGVESPVKLHSVLTRFRWKVRVKVKPDFVSWHEMFEKKRSQLVFVSFSIFFHVFFQWILDSLERTQAFLPTGLCVHIKVSFSFFSRTPSDSIQFPSSLYSCSVEWLPPFLVSVLIPPKALP